MASLAGLALGLGLVFGFLMLAVAAEFYYLLCWKKRAAKKDVESPSYTKDILQFNCLKKQKPSTLSDSSRNVFQDRNGMNPIGGNAQDTELEIGKELPLMRNCDNEESVDSELMRLHGLGGPPRFLFTIKEESKEDMMESEDGRSIKGSRSRTRSLSDLLAGPDGQPIFSPLHSPMRRNSVSSSEFEFSSPFKSASPPPKFKFLRDAEEKFYWRLKVEAENKGGSSFSNAAKERDQIVPNLCSYSHSSSSQVIPLSSSPADFRPLEKKLTSVH